MLGPHDVGRRVVIRRIVGVRDNRPVFTDVLGRLTDASETHFTVRTRSGTVHVPKIEIVRAKAVPDRRRPTATEALELAAAAGWPAAEEGRLGDWLLRATEGWTMRGNSALPIGDPGVPIDEAISAVTTWYRARGLPPAIAVPLPLHGRLDAELTRRGWTANPLTLVMTAPLASLRPEPGDVLLSAEPSAHWMSSAAGRKGPFPAAARTVLTSVAEVRFASVYSKSGALLATGRGCVADEAGRWLGLALIGTEEAARRRGLARQVISALVDWARGIGARDAYLQVEERNTVAVALYTRLGFTAHHAYVNRVLSA